MSKYKFGKSVLKKSAGDFKQFVKGRYPELKGAELDGVVEYHYGKDEGAAKLNGAPEGDKPKEEGGKPAGTSDKGKGSK